MTENDLSHYLDILMEHWSFIQPITATIGALLIGFFYGQVYAHTKNPKHNKGSGDIQKDYILASEVVTHVANKSGTTISKSVDADIELEAHELTPCAAKVLGQQSGHTKSNEYMSVGGQLKTGHSWKGFVKTHVIPALAFDAKKHVEELVPSYLEDYLEELDNMPKKKVQQQEEQQPSLAHYDIIQSFAQENIELDLGIVSRLVRQLERVNGVATWEDILEAIEKGYQDRLADPLRHNLKSIIKEHGEGHLYKIGVQVQYKEQGC
eukprot:TRINITY_DN3403_c0_g1_i3.p1 TRINITY_DN3403_c0_g1~~TRINITY_DN3403_c0_g1_i3.p1  ORF type:complete len:296 (-),score=22.07 TRINITY_DN3403_c0_g1_i3:24-818(-)